MIELVRETIIDDTIIEGRNIGLLESRKEGRNEGKLFTIKSMLKENCSLDLISKVTGKSLKEIKKLKIQ